MVRQQQSNMRWSVFLCAVAVVGLLIAISDAAPPDASAPLTFPPILKNLSTAPHTVEVNLTAQTASLRLLPGVETSVYSFNGSIPGPTLEVTEGDRVIVHFKNDLPEETTVHWHGIHLPVEADGNPMDPVAPGDSYDYVFTVLPGTAGTYWYHPHPHHATGEQVANGLFGAIIVRSATDPLAGSLPEKLLILTDNHFDDDGSIIPPSSDDQTNGREGDVLFVNSQIRPTIAIRAGEIQRWRVVNASAARYYRLALAGHTFLQVGSDGGLFERPVERSEILLTPAERVEVLVRGTGAPGSTSVLQTLPYDRYAIETRPDDWDRPRDLLTLQYTADPPVSPARIPATLRPVPTLSLAKVSATRIVRFTKFSINDQQFDMDRVDITVPLNATEIWRIVNETSMDHPFHMHGFAFQVLDANGIPIPVWKDTVNVRKNETVSFIVEFKDYPGKRMFHCHILNHEDHGMMAVLEVVAR